MVLTWGILPSPSSDGAGDISWLSQLGEWGLGGCFCYVVDTEASNAVKHSRMYRTLTQQRIIRPKIPIVPRPRLKTVVYCGQWWSWDTECKRKWRRSGDNKNVLYFICSSNLFSKIHHTVHFKWAHFIVCNFTSKLMEKL